MLNLISIYLKFYPKFSLFIFITFLIYMVLLAISKISKEGLFNTDTHIPELLEGIKNDYPGMYKFMSVIVDSCEKHNPIPLLVFILLLSFVPIIRIILLVSVFKNDKECKIIKYRVLKDVSLKDSEGKEVIKLNKGDVVEGKIKILKCDGEPYEFVMVKLEDRKILGINPEYLEEV